MSVLRYRYRGKSKVWTEHADGDDLFTILQFLIPRDKEVIGMSDRK